MNGNALPVYVLGIVREKGHPVQLVNACEIPVRNSRAKALADPKWGHLDWKQDLYSISTCAGRNEE
jgi:hypothetical protein